jgi:hypothetical protein
MIRRFLARVRANLAFVIAAAILVAAVALLLTQTASSPSPSGSGVTGGAPAFTYRESWTFPELTRAAGAGEIVAISVATKGSILEASGATPRPVDGMLVARTSSGGLVLVLPGVTTNEAIDSLRSLGFGRLLSKEAIDYRAAVPTGGGGGGSTIVMIGRC